MRIGLIADIHGNVVALWAHDMSAAVETNQSCIMELLSPRPARFHRRRVMISLIADNKDAIAALCRKYGIRKLDVFGSAATGAFDPETSDIDFIVDLGGYERGVSRRYFRFIDELEELFGRSVELITEDQMVDPGFRQSVEEHRINVYDAREREAAA